VPGAGRGAGEGDEGRYGAPCPVFGSFSLFFFSFFFFFTQPGLATDKDGSRQREADGPRAANSRRRFPGLPRRVPIAPPRFVSPRLICSGSRAQPRGPLAFTSTAGNAVGPFPADVPACCEIIRATGRRWNFTPLGLSRTAPGRGRKAAAASRTPTTRPLYVRIARAKECALSWK
jgi:hypothetical protein